MTVLQPDQQPDLWGDHVSLYESVFEPVSNLFAVHALDRLHIKVGDRLIDIACGCGGPALLAAERGADVLAVDAAWRMVARVRARAHSRPGQAGSVQAEVMDGTRLLLPDGGFDAAISVFGVILFPEAGKGMQELSRVLKPGGRAAVVAWTEPERYELAARVLAAIAAVRGPQPVPASLPAQLRFRDRNSLQDLVTDSGLTINDINRMERQWRLPSARWLADNMTFAPGMAAMMQSLGGHRTAILRQFVETLEADQGKGEIVLTAVAHLAIASKT